MTQEEQYVEMIIQTKDWYDGKIEQLQQIVNLDKESKIMVQGEDGKQIELPEQHRKGFIFGITLALEVMGKFPINITKDSDEK